MRPGLVVARWSQST